MQKLQSLKKDYERVGLHLQRLYKRKELTEDGKVIPTMYHLMEPYGFEERPYTRRPGG